MTEIERKINNILESAKRERKHDWGVYNTYKNQIDNLYLDADEYTRAIRILCNILEV